VNKHDKAPIKIILGLGNPGKQFHHTRHNIGFLVLDELGSKYGAVWSTVKDKEVAEIAIDGNKITLVKPQTFMNSSGKVLPSLLKQGLSAHNVLVVHDELEKPFGVVDIKQGGSHRGHNGLRSLMEFCGQDFMRVRCGIGRPVHKEDVADYVLSNFIESDNDVEAMINKAITMIEQLIS
jgi:PTH1 family peptidyl-tRNA hydrolase